MPNPTKRRAAKPAEKRGEAFSKQTLRSLRLGVYFMLFQVWQAMDKHGWRQWLI
jgi:uncharacterized membrane protein